MATKETLDAVFHDLRGLDVCQSQKSLAAQAGDCAAIVQALGYYDLADHLTRVGALDPPRTPMTEPAFQPSDLAGPSGEIGARVTEYGTATIYLDRIARTLTHDQVHELAEGTLDRDVLDRMIVGMFNDGDWDTVDASSYEFDGYVNGGLTETLQGRLADWAVEEVARIQLRGQIRLDGTEVV